MTRQKKQVFYPDIPFLQQKNPSDNQQAITEGFQIMELNYLAANSASCSKAF
jgi:hypothetical protein